MADQKLTALTELLAPISTDLFYAVDDPGGTPLSRKVTVGNVLDIISGDINVNSSGISTYNPLSIVNADISASAAIALSKIATSTSAQLAAIISNETGTGLLVFGTSPTIVTPTIASFANATHSHLNAAGGGTITEAAISDLQSYLLNLVEDTTPQLGGALDGQGNDLNNLGVIFMTEQAAAEADVAGKGQIWVKTATPNKLFFTNDAGSDIELGVGGTTIMAHATDQDDPSVAIEWGDFTGQGVFGSNENRRRAVASRATVATNIGITIPLNAQIVDGDIRLRVNSTNVNLKAVITFGNTGFFQDTTNSDSVSAGDDINNQLTTDDPILNLDTKGTCIEFS